MIGPRRAVHHRQSRAAFQPDPGGGQLFILSGGQQVAASGAVREQVEARDVILLERTFLLALERVAELQVQDQFVPMRGQRRVGFEP